MITLISTTTWEHQESVLFQPVLKAYPTYHSWIITSHISLGNLEKKWKMFTRQMDRTQVWNSLLQKPLAPPHLFSTLEAELISLDSIHTSYKPLILAATQLFKKEPSFDGVLVSNKHHSSCIIGKYGETMEAVHQTDDQNMSTINLSPAEAFSSNSIIIST